MNNAVQMAYVTHDDGAALGKEEEKNEDWIQDYNVPE